MKNPFSEKAAHVAQEIDLNEQLIQANKNVDLAEEALGRAYDEEQPGVPSAASVAAREELNEAQQEVQRVKLQINFRKSESGKKELAARETSIQEKQVGIEQVWKSLLSVAAEFDEVMKDFKETTSDLIEAVKAVADVDLSARTQMGIAKSAIKTVILWHSPESVFDSRLAGKDLSIMQFLNYTGVKNGNQ